MFSYEAMDCYNRGDYKRAAYYFEQAALQGDSTAQYNLGYMYEEGLGVIKDSGRAAYWYEKAAKNGELEAQYNLALLYAHGDGVKQSYEDAIYWYTKAAERGFKEAQHNLARIYHFGNGTKRDYVKACYWYREAAYRDFDLSQNNLGYMYEKGYGVEQNGEKAIYWYELAAEQGNMEAMCNLGSLYYSGELVTKDRVKAWLWYGKAAAKGSMVGLHNTALINYHSGEKQGYKKAVETFKAMENIGEAFGETYYYLGECYNNGYGVRRNPKKAKAYYEKAIESGYDCRYDLDVTRAELKEYKETTGMEAYAKQMFSLKLEKDKRQARVEKDLKNDFGENWEKLHPDAQSKLITGLFVYLNLYELGEYSRKELDFSPVIFEMSQALEIMLAEYFFAGYLRYLKAKNIPVTEFPSNSCLIFVKTDNKGVETFRKYREGHETSRCTLGSFYHILFNDEVIARYKMDGSAGEKRLERPLNKHIIEYVDSLFTKAAFDKANREQEIKDYLTELAADVNFIRKHRNPAAHGKKMTRKHAEICGDYLIRVKKIICGFLSKVKYE